MNLKFQLQLGMMNLTCLMDHIQFQTFKIILSTLLKKLKLADKHLKCYLLLYPINNLVS